MIPKHNNPEYWRYNQKQTKQFRANAPYNFVPLPELVVTTDNIPELDRYSHHTGYIDCTLKTESPLYTRLAVKPEFFREWGDKIRDMMKDQTAREQYAQFFHIDQLEPVIPGSSLRGMIRSLIEIGGFGKVQWVTNEPLVYRAVGDRSSLGEFYRVRMMHKEAGLEREMRFTPLMKAGYLENRDSKWYIRPAQEHNGVSFARIRWYGEPKLQQKPSGKLEKWHQSKNAFRIWIQPNSYEYRELRKNLYTKFMTIARANAFQTSGMYEGVLVLSGDMQRKKYETVFFPPAADDSKLIEVTDEILHLYYEQITQEQQNLIGTPEHENLLIDKQPVFYLTEPSANRDMSGNQFQAQQKLVFFGHTMMFRLPYQYAPIDFVPARLRNANDTDLADAIFGSASDTKSGMQNSRAGRVFFMNACPKSGESDLLYEGSIPLKILASPKPTTFQHYLTQQEPDMLDTGNVDKSGEPKTELNLQHYANSPDFTAIRGHKLYWHKGKDFDDKSIIDQEFVEKERQLAQRGQDIWRDGKDLEGNERKGDSQRTMIRAVKPDKLFQFRVHFENLRDFELGALLWALSLPAPKDSNLVYRHKLGMGKPLGLGTVHIQIDQLILSQRACTGENNLNAEVDKAKTEMNGRYESLFSGGLWHQPEASEDSSPFIVSFMDEVTRRLAGERNNLSFFTLPRIRMLCKLLQFPGPNEQLTQYMALSEFKERPVLPDPFQISTKLKDGFRPVTESRNFYGHEQPLETSLGLELSRVRAGEYQPDTQLINDVLGSMLQRTTERKEEVLAQDATQVSYPAMFDEVKVGMSLEGHIAQIMFNQVQLELCVPGVMGKLEEKDMHPEMVNKLHSKTLNIGDKVIVTVKRIDKKNKPIAVVSVSLS